jgi:hypothetical protein
MPLDLRLPVPIHCLLNKETGADRAIESMQKKLQKLVQFDDLPCYSTFFPAVLRFQILLGGSSDILLSTLPMYTVPL